MSLFRIAESAYTRAMSCAREWRLRRDGRANVRLFACAAFLLAAVECVSTPSANCQTPAATEERDTHELYDALNALRIDPAAVYRVEAENRISLRRGDATLSFDEGKLGFFSALDGRITGVVFSGRGHALAAPRDPVEKQQMGRFLDASVLDEDFDLAYLRFTDATADELFAQLRNAKLTPQNDPGFAAHWESLVEQFNNARSLRVMNGLITQNLKPYFYAHVDGATTGPFDVVYDLQRAEPFLLGQMRPIGGQGGGHGGGQNGGAPIYDVWVSYVPPGDAGAPATFHAGSYVIETTIEDSKALEGSATIEVQAAAGGERLMEFTLSRALTVDRVSELSTTALSATSPSIPEPGTPLAFFQNEGLSAHARSARGLDTVFVVLPRAASAGERLRLHFHYRGKVIADAGNGVLVVGAQDSWYPHMGDSADFAHYDLTMRWPKKMRLVATGRKIDERADGDYRVGHWRSDHPVSEAGFNLGDYASASVAGANYSVDLYANRQLEESLRRRLQPAPDSFPSAPRGFGKADSGLAGHLDEPPAPSPVEALRELGKQIDICIRFYEKFGGPFPFSSLSVSQIPGNFGQGWPGLLYLSTYSYLSPEAQRAAGLSVSGQEHFTELVPFHEVAHQWWGNVVGWSSYRDQWIDEAIASYLALMFADSRRSQEHPLRVWLERFRKSLVTKPENGGENASESGALTLGWRLDSSKAPQDYDVMIYSKGSWVVHMLREMLRQPSAKDPDARFTQLLQTLAAKYAYRDLSTEDLQKEVEAVMTPAMDLEGGRSMEWFFEEWIRGTGIPRYHVDFNTHATDKGFLVKGTLAQEGVPRSFIAPVPLYAAIAGGRTVYLGTVTAEGVKTAFHFTTPAAPRKIIVDPEMTLLCVSE